MAGGEKGPRGPDSGSAENLEASWHYCRRGSPQCVDSKVGGKASEGLTLRRGIGPRRVVSVHLCTHTNNGTSSGSGESNGGEGGGGRRAVADSVRDAVRNHSGSG